jgi:SAM-dependent methyltransferase
MSEELTAYRSGVNEPEPLQRQFDAVAASWDAKHGSASSRAPEFAARVRYLRKICAALGRPSVLDLGCGTGQVLIELLPVIKCGIGVDISPAMIEHARRATQDHRVQFHVGDAARFCSLWEGRFDVVLLIGTLDHLPDQVQALAAAGRLIHPRGRLIVISPHPWSPIFLLRRLVGWGRDMPPARHLSPRRLVAHAREHGLRIIRIRALPYAPWRVLSPLFARLPTTGLFGPRSSLTGTVRGAFAAEFRPG